MGTIKRTQLQSEIIEFIKQYIDEHNLKIGDRLPSQEELINLMGVSRSSLREAIKTLEAKEIQRLLMAKEFMLKMDLLI